MLKRLKSLASLLIILLEVWSVARKYAFNPPKVRFQSTLRPAQSTVRPAHHLKRFLRVAFPGLRAPARLPLAITCTSACLRAGSGGPPPRRAHASFRRSLHKLPSTASATLRQRLAGLRPRPCFSFAEPAPACSRPCPAATQASRLRARRHRRIVQRLGLIQVCPDLHPRVCAPRAPLLACVLNHLRPPLARSAAVD
jgi:hypothetical protein